MFERILVPLDGSPRAEMIFGQLSRILRREESELALLRVVDVGSVLAAADAAGRVDMERLTDEERQRAQVYIEEQVRRIAERGVRVSGRVAQGMAAETILAQAEALGATMIALATHGRSGVKRWMMGSVAEKVLRGSAVPVLLLRSFRRTPEGDLEPAAVEEAPFRRILVPTDGSPASEAALGPASTMARLFQSEVLILHAEMPRVLPGEGFGRYQVLPPTPSWEDPVTERAVERLKTSGLRTERVTVSGDAAAEILDLARARGVDLIVMATHGRSGVSRLFLGSVAERVLRSAEVPLLLVRS